MYMNIKEVAVYLRVCRQTAYRRLVKWKVPIVRDGRIVRVSKDELDKALRKLAGFF
ncbi:MAG: excisionase family DNA-binding protein [Planctomycetia bacterium]|nr:excisionase family DNA-binding protein [Planctomycetia bacterium]